jgi:hypothetical protein
MGEKICWAHASQETDGNKVGTSVRIGTAPRLIATTAIDIALLVNEFNEKVDIYQQSRPDFKCRLLHHLFLVL